MAHRFRGAGKSETVISSTPIFSSSCDLYDGSWVWNPISPHPLVDLAFPMDYLLPEVRIQYMEIYHLPYERSRLREICHTCEYTINGSIVGFGGNRPIIIIELSNIKQCTVITRHPMPEVFRPWRDPIADIFQGCRHRIPVYSPPYRLRLQIFGFRTKLPFVCRLHCPR